MTQLTRRRTVLKLASLALANLPLAVIAERAGAATNTALRDQLKYQDRPEGDKVCSMCLEFIPGKTDQDPGGCKLIPGDDEIFPNGYCTAWNTL